MKKIKVMLKVFIFIFSIIELVSYIALENLSSFLPVPLLDHFKITSDKQILNTEKERIYGYEMGQSSFDKITGWDNFTSFYDRKSPDKFINLDYKKHLNSKNELKKMKFSSYEKKPLAVTFGDSFTYCDDVFNDFSWQKILSDKYGKKIQNGGTLSFGLDQAYLKSSKTVNHYKPKYMIMCLSNPMIIRTLGRLKNFLEEYCPLPPIFKPRFKIKNDKLTLLPVPFSNMKNYIKTISPNNLQKICKNDGWYNFYKRLFDYDLLKGFKFPYTQSFINFVKGYYYFKKNEYPLDIKALLEQFEIQEIKKCSKISNKILKKFQKDCLQSKITPVVIILSILTDSVKKNITKFCYKNSIPIFHLTDIIDFDIAQTNFDANVIRYFDSNHYSVFGNTLVAQRMNLFLDFLPEKKLTDYQIIEKKIINSKPDFIFPVWNTYINLIVKFLSNINITTRDYQIFSTMLAKPFSSKNVKLFANNLILKISQKKPDLKEIIPAINTLKTFSKALEYIKTAENKFKNKKYAHSELLIKQTLNIIPGWKKCTHLAKLIKKRSTKLQKINFVNYVTSDLKNDMENFKKSHNFYLKAMKQINLQNYSNAEGLLKKAVISYPSFLDATFSLALVRLLNFKNIKNRAVIKKSIDLIYTTVFGPMVSDDCYEFFLVELLDFMKTDFSFIKIKQNLKKEYGKAFFSSYRKKNYLKPFEDLQSINNFNDFIESFVQSHANHILSLTNHR